MYKKSLLSYTATVAIILSSMHFNAHAEILKASGAEQEITGKPSATYEIIHAEKGGKITGENLTVTGNKDTNKDANKGTSEGKNTPPLGSSSLESPAAVTAEGKGSIITLTGDKTTIKGTDSAIIIGVEAKDGGTISMTGGSINASDFGAVFLNSNSDKNKLNGVTISSSDDKTLLGFGVGAENSTITLKDVIIKQTENALSAKGGSTITITGGSFASKEATIAALQNSEITIEGAQITSSDNSGLMAQNSGSISMNGGSIKASQAGAYFTNSNSDKNKLKDVEISSNEGGTAILFGVKAENESKVYLEGVRFSHADSGISADNNSEITISKGEFDAKRVTIHAENGSTITLKDNTKVTSSNNVGLAAEQKSTIKMTGGEVTGKVAAIVAKNGGHTTIENVTLTIDGAAPVGNSDLITSGFGVFSEGKDSLIELTGNDTKIKNSIIGLQAKEDGAISMNGGSINASLVGARFTESKNDKNKLKDIEISSNKENEQLTNGIKAEKESTVSLENVNVKQAGNAIVADSNSKIEITGGSFDAKVAAIVSTNGSTITVSDSTMTSSKGDGLFAKDGGAISMKGGSIKAFYNGATFNESNRAENKLENVTISSGQDGRFIDKGISAEKSSVTLNKVTITNSNTAILANDNSTITVSEGSFDGKTNGVYAKQGSSITLDEKTTVTSSEGTGLHAEGSEAKITKTGGTVSGKQNALFAEKGGQIDVTDVTLTTTDGKGTGAKADGADSVITLKGKTTIEKVANGLEVENGATIKMTDSSITASQIGAVLNDSKNDENKLENVTISSGKDNPLMDKGIDAEKSSVTLNKVTITNSNTAILANDNSTITVSEGSFDGKTNGVYAKQGSSITLNNSTVTSSEGNGLHAEGSDSKIIMVGGSATTKNEHSSALLAKNKGTIDATDVTLTTNGIGTGALALGESTIQLHGNTTINNTFNGLGAADGGKITGENLNITGGKAINSGTDTERSGLTTKDAGSEINLTGKTIIQNVDEGLYADGGSKITSGDLTIIGGESEKITSAVGSYESVSKIELNGNTIIKNFDLGLGAAGDASIIMKNGTKNEIDVKKMALSAVGTGKIDLENTFAKAGSIGLQLMALSKTNTDKLDDLQTYGNNEINLTNTEIHVDNGTGILVGAIAKKSIGDIPTLSIGTVNLHNSEIHADILLNDGVFWDKISWQEENIWNDKNVKEIANGSFTLNADHSILEGRTNIAQERNVSFNLRNGTQWFLKNSTQEKDAEGNLLDITQRSRSDISVLDLNDSSLIFQEPTEDHYHTLHIGSGKADTQEVYNASGNAEIHFNTAWSDGVASADQKTDRLLIHGDVSGFTTVYIDSDSGDKNSVVNASDPSNTGGISLIQVSGKADENSFKLAHGYITRGGSPYKYTLTAYGPESSHGQADIAQSLFDEKNENFWDFRLHREILETGSGSNPSVISVVPQTASYIVMPNALFHAGLTDIAKQDQFLATMRMSIIGQEQGIKNAFFLYTYGNTATLSSKRGPLEYGYGANIRYAALQAGVVLAAIEGQNTITHLGLGGTYGRLSFTPKDMQDAGKNTLDKWALTAYGSIQHSSGFYIDALLSYGILKGEITNALIGKTAKLNDAKMLSISTTVGKEFATGVEGLTFEPQAQVAYQHLMFNTIEDADNLTIDMKNPSQWLIRVGGRLTKTISTENNHPMSFYGKVNLIKTFGDDGSIHIGRDFDLDPMGPAIEGGVGINAQLSTNLSLHGDVSYQQKLQKTGISGASFSGGIRYQF
ncbi:autotransporter outer membrane beta-barrel domain-containing protein [Bartonella sp. AU55XJBT]|uniref:autotransporter outer membrane beta-barrel domain-containing protein n=1 Tax=Bartonella sp. AU55XJBT TaxID=3019091 RepID=UPI0023618EDA|nr:autotransporter outer membrane beta-barrel domain-containing protein [Bartonella sp. AU55XJBT]